MELTPQQKTLLTRYLREVCTRYDANLPEHARARMMERLERRLRYDLEALGKDTITDKDIVGVIRQHARSSQARGVQFEELDAVLPEPLVADDPRVWLGVCARTSDRLNVPVWIVRSLAVLLGLTGPFVLIAYLLLYGELYLSLPPEKRPLLEKWRMAGMAIATVLGAIAIHLVAVFSSKGIYLLYERALQRPIPDIGPWGWLEMNTGSFLFWTILCGVPLAILSALPLAHLWAHTMKRLTQALLALYATAVSFGLACILVGVILDFVREWTG